MDISMNINLNILIFRDLATVITNLVSAIPYIGQDIVITLWGGFSVGNPTLNRFFSLHYLLPFILFALVFLHLNALHEHGFKGPKFIIKFIYTLILKNLFLYCLILDLIKE